MRLPVSVLALAAAACRSAAAQEFPTRRAGLWEVTINHDGGKMPAQTMQQCTDAETDKLMNAFGGDLSADMCSKQEVKKVGATLVINAICQIGPMKSVSESVVSGDFNSNYSVKVTSKLEGVPAGGQGHGRRHHDHPGALGRCVQAGSTAGRHHDVQRPDDEHPRSSQGDASARRNSYSLASVSAGAGRRVLDLVVGPAFAARAVM